MPRRTATPATPAPPASLPPPPHDLALLEESHTEWAANLHILRRQWKWANFSQFFYTFAPLLAMSDVFLADVEDDLARGTNVYLPRIMHRLLYALSQDRKLKSVPFQLIQRLLNQQPGILTSIDNWQSALRRQYLRRDPFANPIGPEPHQVLSRESSLSPSENEDREESPNHDLPELDTKPMEDIQAIDGDDKLGELVVDPTQEWLGSDAKAELAEDADTLLMEPDEQPPPKVEDEEESKDWLELPMLDKLDSLHLLTEWQFQNSHRLRQLMKNDDEAAEWRMEPIGYDAKTNAYWLIGPDRLWIQRAPPKPPRNRTLKRKRTTSPKKTDRPKAAELPFSDGQDDGPVASKRTRVQSQQHSHTRSSRQSNTRATRTSRRATQTLASLSDLTTSGKSTRAAKVQANKKLDIQAKELAEFQRQNAVLVSAKARSSPRKSRGIPASSAKRTVGTRVSARLRSSTKGGDDDDDDDEWQQVPEEWLQERATPERRTSGRRSRTKARAEPEKETEEEDPEADGEVENNDKAEPEAEADSSAEAEVTKDIPEDGDPLNPDSNEEEQRVAEKEEDGAQEAGENADEELLQRAGLESGSVSDLTDLSDAEDDDDDEQGADEPQIRRRRNTRKTAVRKSARQTRQTKADTHSEPKSKSKSKQGSQLHDQLMDEPPLPEDFVEWEAIAITLSEWEHIADPFEKATHYLEKALYRMLTRSIIPIVTADLREAEKRRRIEEAVVRRKRSSRIAIKESEKEEARMAALKKAEEEKKFARERRQEARGRKEEEERMKRENAREQRRKDREEREARARTKAEREEAAAARSTATPSVNDTQQLSSLLPSRVVTPNGVHTPDWMLDCEICHKHGLNVDDGKAMVSCGSCNRWQHIVCHDLHDQRTGRPRRDWEKQQFFCSRCRQRMLNVSGYNGQGPQSYSLQQQQYGWQQSGRPIHLHKPGGVDPFASDLRYSQRSPLESGMGYPSMPNAGYPRSSYSNAGSLFNHYQPDQLGQPSRVIASTSQGSWGSSNGYLYGAEQLSGRVEPLPVSHQYSQNGGNVYSSSRIAPAYQSRPSSAHLPFNTPSDTTVGMSSVRWSSTTSNGYHSPPSTAAQEAAQSLAFMHGSSRFSGSGWPSPSQASSYGQHQPQSSYPPTIGIDPLTGHSFTTTPRVE